jgi:hypothetical protein
MGVIIVCKNISNAGIDTVTLTYFLSTCKFADFLESQHCAAN